MKLLLDTHVLLWWLADDARLGREARAVVSSSEHVVYVSAVTIWEIVIKRAMGKLELPDDFSAVVEASGFLTLPITASHAWALGFLPLLHRDPFDRMLVAQACAEGMTLVSADGQLGQYNVDLLRA